MFIASIQKYSYSCILILYSQTLLNVHITSSCLFVDSFRILHRQLCHLQIKFYFFLSYLNAFYLFFFKALFLILVFLLSVTWYESSTQLQFTCELTKTYNLTDFGVCIHFSLRDTQLSLAPVSCNELVGFLGNWTQSLGDYLDGRPDSRKSKIPYDRNGVFYLC